MRGSYEESPEQKAHNELVRAARRYAGAYLSDMFGQQQRDAEKLLEFAAVAYAATQPRPRKSKAK
jgi:hypothetical protein